MSDPTPRSLLERSRRVAALTLAALAGLFVIAVAVQFPTSRTRGEDLEIVAVAVAVALALCSGNAVVYRIMSYITLVFSFGYFFVTAIAVWPEHSLRTRAYLNFAGAFFFFVCGALLGLDAQEKKSSINPLPKDCPPN